MRNKGMVIIIIVLLVVLTAAAGLGVYFFVLRGDAEGEMTVNAPATHLTLRENEIFDIVLESSIRTNLQESTDGTQHFITIDLSVGVNNTVDKESTEIINLLTEKEQVMRNVALNVIRRKTFDELKRPDGLEILQNDILVRLQEQFNSNLIIRVIGSDMMLQ